MRIRPLHSWDLTPKEAIALQRRLVAQNNSRPPVKRCELIAGADVSYARFSNVFFAGVVVLRTSDWTVVERQGAVRISPFPYVPGLLSFREAPAVLDAFAKLKSKPDAVIYDGHGVAHPRRFGIAAHLGLWLKCPCVGCAKSRLTGEHEEPKREAGSSAPLIDGGDVIGQVVRTKTGVKPVFVSVGHLVNLAGAVRLVLESCRGYRLPEPTRQAHLHVNALRRQAASGNP
jgi:deoxyribonuclease V